MSSEESAAMKCKMFKKESGANTERLIGGKGHSRGWRSGLKESNKMSEVARGHRPDESEKTL
jgi:hypothetical protein